MRPRGADSEALIVRKLAGDPLRSVARQLAPDDVVCFRLTCALFREHSEPPAAKSHAAFVRTLPLLRWAWAQLDGFKDLVVLNGHIDDHTHVGIPREMQPQLFGGLGNGKFELIESPEAGDFWNREILGRSLVTLDFNKDGRLDLIAGDLEQPATLLENNSNLEGKSLYVALVGTESDRNAICTVVTVSDANSEFGATEQLTGGSGYQASNQRMLQFALPTSIKSVQLNVQWPSGKKDEYSISVDSTTNEVKVVESIGAFSIPASSSN